MVYQERPPAQSQSDDPRVCYEIVDGVLYQYSGPAGDPGRPAGCEEVDGEWYPFEDEGAPVVQGILHGETTKDLVNMVTGLLLDWPDVGIFSDVFLRWEKGQRKPYGPDLFVLPRVHPHKGKRKRQSVYEWQEPSKTIFVMEVLSDSNDRDDPDEKFFAYQNRGQIPEFLICDPRTETPQIWGYRLESGSYEPIRPDERGRIFSEQLRGWFGVNDQGEIQVWNEENAPMPRYEEAVLAMDAALKRASQEAARANEEAARANEEAKRADEEAKRAAAAEARLRELEAELKRLRGSE